LPFESKEEVNNGTGYRRKKSDQDEKNVRRKMLRHQFTEMLLKNPGHLISAFFRHQAPGECRSSVALSEETRSADT
jgi:hypothetical protein